MWIGEDIIEVSMTDLCPACKLFETGCDDLESMRKFEQKKFINIVICQRYLKVKYGKEGDER